MARFGFVGGSYRLTNITADFQRCMGWYPETDESGLGNSAMILQPTPGLKVFCGGNAGERQVRGQWTINGLVFAIIENNLYQIFANGTRSASLGIVANDQQPVSMVASPFQLFIASGGNAYVYQFQAQPAPLNYAIGTFTKLPGNTFSSQVDLVGYVDGFFIALVANSQEFWVSNSLDATMWNNNGAKIISTFADNVVSMIVNQRLIALLGGKESEWEYDSGNIFPFDTVPSGYMEQGCAATYATTALDNSFFFIGARNDQGQGIAWRINGYSPQRVSTHAIEQAWQSYPMISDARAFAYQDQGHTFWVINFPSGNTTWVYDVATGLWHERGYWSAAGQFQAALPQNHVFAFGKHLVGDRQSGTIYEMHIPVANGAGWDFCTDAGNPIVRDRIAPHISTEQQWMRHAQLQVYMETGLGPLPPLLDGNGVARAPEAQLRYSDDGGHTWSNFYARPCGQAGEFLTRVIWRRMGRSRDRVYHLRVSDPIPWRITDAYLTATPGFEAQERLPKSYAKVS